jgi:GNAT superfamily N-acetyltransferase
MPDAAPPPTPPPEPHPFSVDGVRFLLRPLGPDDATRLQDFFYSHTLETIQLRYGHAVARMTPERAFDLVNVDQTRDLALAIFGTEDSREVIHAVGRYYLDPSGRSAEAAFVVRESCRRRGFATRLMQSMVLTARRRGLEVLWGRVRRDNLPMLALFRHFGAQPLPVPDGGFDVDMRISLQPTVDTSAPVRPTKTKAPSRQRKKRRLLLE